MNCGRLPTPNDARSGSAWPSIATRAKSVAWRLGADESDRTHAVGLAWGGLLPMCRLLHRFLGGVCRHPVIETASCGRERQWPNYSYRALQYYLAPTL